MTAETNREELKKAYQVGHFDGWNEAIQTAIHQIYTARIKGMPKESAEQLAEIMVACLRKDDERK